MLFEALSESARRGELLLVDGGFCHWHLRRDGQLTIREIITTWKGCGVGALMLDRLMHTPGATCIVAKCPADLRANGWWADQGFERVSVELTRHGRDLNLWRLDLT